MLLPTANGGTDKIAAKGAIVILNGRASSGSGTLTYAWTPHPDNEFTVTLNGADNVNPNFTVPANPSADSLQFNLIVTNAAGTSEPAVVKIRIRPFILEGVPEQSYTTGVSITTLVLPNARGNTKSYSLTPLVPGLTFDTDADIRTLSGTPTTAGTYDLTYTVTSNGTNTDSLSFRVIVNNSNNAPMITGTPADTVVAGETYSFTAIGSDIDTGDTLTYWISGNPSWLTINPATGELSGIPASTDVGTTTDIVISVMDNATPPLMASLAPFDLEVINPSTSNSEPTGGVTITGSITNGVTAPDGLLFANNTLADVDGPATLTTSYQWNLSDTAAGVRNSISGATSFFYRAYSGDTGKFITVTASYTDDAGIDESVTSEPVRINTLPTITSIPDLSVAQGQPYRFAPVGNDADGEPLTYRLFEAASWLGIDPGTGVVSGTPTNADVGDASFIVRVSDGIHATRLLYMGSLTFPWW